MASDKHIPLGFPALVPYLTVDEPDKLIAFVKSAFGAEEMKEQRWEHPAGKVIRSALRVEGCVIETRGASAARKAMPANIHLYVRDVDGAYDRAPKAGGGDIPMVREMDDDEASAG